MTGWFGLFVIECYFANCQIRGVSIPNIPKIEFSKIRKNDFHDFFRNTCCLRRYYRFQMKTNLIFVFSSKTQSSMVIFKVNLWEFCLKYDYLQAVMIMRAYRKIMKSRVSFFSSQRSPLKLVVCTPESFYGPKSPWISCVKGVQLFKAVQQGHFGKSERI